MARASDRRVREGAASLARKPWSRIHDRTPADFNTTLEVQGLLEPRPSLCPRPLEFPRILRGDPPPSSKRKLSLWGRGALLTGLPRRSLISKNFYRFCRYYAQWFGILRQPGVWLHASLFKPGALATDCCWLLGMLSERNRVPRNLDRVEHTLGSARRPSLGRCCDRVYE
jgi:hypothetical protein